MTFDRYSWEQTLMGASAKPTSKLVGFVLASHANNETGKCWPSQPTLLAETSLTRNTLRAGVEELVTLGLLTAAVSRGRGNSTTYFLTNVKGSTTHPITKRVNDSPFKSETPSAKGSKSEIKGSMVDIKGSTIDPQLLITTKELLSADAVDEKPEVEEEPLTIKSITQTYIEVLDAWIESGEYTSTQPFRMILDTAEENSELIKSLTASGKGLESIRGSIVAHAWGHFFDGIPCPFGRLNSSKKILGPDWAKWLISAMTFATTKEINGDLAAYVITTATNKKAETK